MRCKSLLELSRSASRREFLRYAIGGSVTAVGVLNSRLAWPALESDVDVRRVGSMAFDVSYSTEIIDLPSDCQQLRIWMPLPPASTHQSVEDLTITCPVPHEIRHDSVYGNAMAFVETTPDAAPFTLKARYRIVRRRSEIEAVEGGLGASREKYMALTPRVKINDDIRAFAAKVAGNEKSARKVGRRIYDSLIEILSYDKSIPGCGTGDTEWIFKHRAGKCDDYHSLFMAMMISQGIPVRWEQGFPLPYPSSENVQTGRLEGDCSGAHCWASFYDQDEGWIPVDVSEADKRPDLADFFFGHLTPNRFKISEGREIVFDPPQGGDPVNSLAYAYAEADGLPLIYLRNFRNTIEFEVNSIEMV